MSSSANDDDVDPTNDIEEGAPPAPPAGEAGATVGADATTKERAVAAERAAVADPTSVPPPLLLRGDDAAPILDDDPPRSVRSAAAPTNEGLTCGSDDRSRVADAPDENDAWPPRPPPPRDSADFDDDERTSVLGGGLVVPDYGGAGGELEETMEGVEGGVVVQVEVGASSSSSGDVAVVGDEAPTVAPPWWKRRLVRALLATALIAMLAAVAAAIGVFFRNAASEDVSSQRAPAVSSSSTPPATSPSPSAGGGSPSSHPSPNETSEIDIDDDEVFDVGDDVVYRDDDKVVADDDEVLAVGDDGASRDDEVGADDDEVLAVADDVGEEDDDFLDRGDDVVSRDDEVGANDDEVMVVADNFAASDPLINTSSSSASTSSSTSNTSIADDDFSNDDVRPDYPEWSWDRVRTYVAIRRGDDYSDEQIFALAAQDVVMLEKYNGHEMHGSVEMGTLVAARRIKAVNAKVKILFYLNCMVHYSGYEANKNFKDEWLLLNPKKNNTPYKWRERLLSYDHTNLEFREWWIQRGLDMLAHEEIDGIFIDAIMKVQSYALGLVKGHAWIKQHGAAYLETARQLRERLPPGKILIGNVLRAMGGGTDGNYRNLQYLDGSYLENWAVPRYLVMSMQLMTKALKEGKIIMLNSDMSHIDFGGIDSLDARYHLLNQSEFIDFRLGYFLLVVEPYAYFSYHWGVDANPRRLNVFDNTRFEAITRKLGKPLGDYVDDGYGGFTREFEHLKVHVNITSQQGTLTVTDRPTSTSSSTGSSSSAPMSTPMSAPIGNSSGAPESSPIGIPSKEPLSLTTGETAAMSSPTSTPTCLGSENNGRLHPHVCPCLTLGCVTVEPRCCSNKCRITMKNVSFCIERG